MDGLSALGTLAGGIGLFLLGMALMTEGLKLAAGSALERILASSTRTRMRGLAAGVLVTALVQSSSAVTIATIGFVNAGLLSLGQALWVLFGANVGTTMTGWLVALVGLAFKIELLALPFIGIGALLRLTGEATRRGAAGTALAGFGLLFLGIDMLRESFSGLSADVELPQGTGALQTLLRVLIGAALTVMMQSSSAALVLALTAAQGGLLTVDAAAAVVIGANIGTTATALIAAIGATPNARRAAAAHVLFNVLTGIVALLLLPWMLSLLSVVRAWLELDEAPALKLAMFHTLFNLLGIVLIWPAASRLTRFLEGRFRSAEEDDAQPRHLDRNVLAVPALALDALDQEVRRMGQLTIAALRASLPDAAVKAAAHRTDAISSLNRAIADFIVELNRRGMSRNSARRLPRILQMARCYESAAALSEGAASAAVEPGNVAPWACAEATRFFLACTRLLDCSEPSIAQVAPDPAVEQEMHAAYAALKVYLLALGAQGALPLDVMDARLRQVAAQRDAMRQVVQAASLAAERLPAVPQAAA